MMEFSRDIHGPAQSRAILDLLQTLFAAELVHPSKPLWLIFAWVTDLEILDNSARQFSALVPDWPAAPVRLSRVLGALLGRGGEVNVVLREHEHNRHFVSRLEGLKQEHGNQVRWAIAKEFHAKGMLGASYFLNGSMNLTVSGVTINDEHVLLRRDPGLLAQQQIELAEKWEAKLT